MAGVLRWVAPVSAVALIALAAVGLGTGNPEGITYDTAAPAPPPAPPVDRPQPPSPPPPEILFTGFIAVSDPTREVMGPDPWLWSESCHRLDIEPAVYDDARANLTRGSSGGELEDLDLYAYDANGARLASAANDTRGIGTHHTLAIGAEVARLVICLSGGSHADYELLVS